MENVVAITGWVSQQPIPIKDINSLSFDGWRIEIKSSRRSGKIDEVVVIAPQHTDVSGFDVDVPVMIIGKMQTVKNFETGRVLVYVLADYVEKIKGEHWLCQNEVKMIGEIGRGTNYRHTPKGTRITDIRVIVPSDIARCNCYIPCICWNGFADKSKDWEEGTRVELIGRLNSRQYHKQIDGKRVEKTCYEVSVTLIRKASN